ncbi:MAG: DUF4340 domain-containing protein [Fibrobacteria bacterium]
MKRTLIVLLAALAVLAAILLKMNSNEKNLQKDSPVLDSTSKSGVTGLRVITKADTSDLQKKDSRWVVGKDGFPVDTAKINKVLGNLFRVQDRELVSNSAARLGEYGLDSVQAKHVKISAGTGKPLAEFVIGKVSGADYNSTYWKWEAKPEVYRTLGNFGYEIATKDDEWKTRKLFTATAKDVKTVETAWKDSTGAMYSYKLEAVTDSTWKMLAPQDSGRVKNALVSEMASRFAEMSIDEFVAANDTNVAKVKLDSPTVDLKIGLKDGTKLELKTGKVLSGFAYVQHPERKDLIKLSGWRLDAFMKKPFELLDAPPAPPADSSHPTAASAGLKTVPMPAPDKTKPAKPVAKKP